MTFPGPRRALLAGGNRPISLASLYAAQTSGSGWNASVATLNFSSGQTVPGTSSQFILLTNTGTTGAAFTTAAITASISSAYIFRVLVKAGTSPFFTIQVSDNTANSFGASFNSADGSFAALGGQAGGGSVMSYYSELVTAGVYRLTVVGRSTAWAAAIVAIVKASSATGGATTNAQTGYFWGA